MDFYIAFVCRYQIVIMNIVGVDKLISFNSKKKKEKAYNRYTFLSPSLNSIISYMGIGLFTFLTSAASKGRDTGIQGHLFHKRLLE